MEMRIRPVSGFTLIELILALALVAILVAVALPSYQSLRQEQMVRAATQAIYTDVMLLKSEAVKRNSNLTLIIFNSGLSGWCYRVAVDGAGFVERGQLGAGVVCPIVRLVRVRLARVRLAGGSSGGG